jgi:uncharacterized protein (TIGR00251 family)
MMTGAHPPVRYEGDDVWLLVHAQPGARQNSFAGVYGEAVKIRLAAPPVDGRANKELCRFLAEACGVAPSAVDVISGEGARAKRVRIKTPQMLPAALRELI